MSHEAAFTAASALRSSTAPAADAAGSPTIDDLLDDPRLLGHVRRALQPGWRPHLRRIFDLDRPAFNVVVTGPPERGTSTVARVALAYALCRVLCLPNALRAYGLLPGSVLRFCLLSATRDQARRTLCEPLHEELEPSAFFARHLAPRAPRGRRNLKFTEPHIEVTVGSIRHPSLYGDVFACVIDLPTPLSHSEQVNAVVDLYWAIGRRILSRFGTATGQTDGLLLLSATSGSAPDLLESHVREIQRLPDGYVASLP